MLFSQSKMKAWVRYCLEQFLDQAEVHIDFVSAKTMQDLNLRYRKKNYPTNVLSFSETLPLPQQQHFLGNIVLCSEVLQQEAEEQQKKFHDHLAHLLVHGCLHLLGYDHEKKSDANKMEALEVEILLELGVGNPY